MIVRLSAAKESPFRTFDNTEGIPTLTEYAHDHRIATDYHINETPMLEQDEHFKHLFSWEGPQYAACLR